jgi:hypothetical protein
MISSRPLFLALAAWTWTATNLVNVVNADPSPDVQKNITAAIKAVASGNGTVDYTKFVNPFVGTGKNPWLSYAALRLTSSPLSTR